MVQVAQVVTMAQTIMGEVGVLRQSMAQELGAMKQTLDAEAARKDEVVMQSDMPTLKATMMGELGAFTDQNLKNYTKSMQEGVAEVLKSQSSQWELAL